MKTGRRVKRCNLAARLLSPLQPKYSLRIFGSFVLQRKGESRHPLCQFFFPPLQATFSSIAPQKRKVCLFAQLSNSMARLPKKKKKEGDEILQEHVLLSFFFLFCKVCLHHHHLFQRSIFVWLVLFFCGGTLQRKVSVVEDSGPIPPFIHHVSLLFAVLPDIIIIYF